jgi:esterase/lipase superfamily enzyme
MLEPALVLESDLSVESALAELERYANFAHVVVRFARPEREPDWYAMPAHRLRWLLEGVDGNETLDAALDLDETQPSPVRAPDTVDTGFEGVVLDGDQVIAVGVAEDALETHRGGRPPRQKASAEENVPLSTGAASNESVVIPVLFATDRDVTGAEAPGKFFGAGRGPLRFGVAEVSIPPTHRRGELEAPVWWKLEFRPDPRRHVTLARVTVTTREDFIALARSTVDGSPRRDALLFVHGYNVSFENAARRTAQIAYDLRFQGVPMLYSWPSTGGTLRYMEDETNARWTVPHFDEFLTMARTAIGATGIHVIAHSMGNRVLTECLRTHRLEGAGAKLLQVVLAAPDIDADTFADLAREFNAQAERVTLYASSGDLALKASKLVHGYPRAGDSEPTLVITDGVDTIDASGIDTNLLGHSYVGTATSILADVHALVENGHAPAERPFHLEAREQQGRCYWLFRT